MNSLTRILKNSTALSLTVLVDRAVSFFLPWFLARQGSDTLWGEYSIAFAFVLVGVPFGFWGMDHILPRDIAKNKQSVGQKLGTAILVSGMASAIVTLILLLIVYLLDYPPALRQLIVLAVWTNILPRAEVKIQESLLNGLERMEWIALVRLPLTVLRTALSIWLLLAGYGVEWVFVVFGLQHVVLIGLYMLVFRRIVPAFSLRPQIHTLRPLLYQGLPFIFIIFTGETFKQLDRIFLSKWWDAGTVGQYATGALPVDITRLVILALMASLFPGLSRVFPQSLARFQQLSQQLFKLFVIASIPLVLFLVSTANWTLPFVFGDGYMPAIPVFKLLAIGLLFLFPGQLLYHILLASHNEQLAVRTAIVRSVAGLALNLWLIPRYGLIGAGIAVSATEAVGLVQNLYFLHTRIFPLSLWNILIQPLLLGLTPLFLFLFFRGEYEFIAGILAIFIFLLLLPLTRTLTLQEIRATLINN